MLLAIRRTIRSGTGATALLVAVATGTAATIHVDDDARGGDGSSWAAAFSHLQDALAWAGTPEHGITEIRVAQGTYLPDRDALHPSGTGSRAATFQLLAGVSLRGGYAGLGAPDPDQRDIDLYPTILSGDLAGNDAPSFQGIEDNSYHVVRASGAGLTALLEGFTVRGGNANAPEDPHGGGLIAMFSGGVTAARCTFRDNRSNVRGGAMYIEDADAALADCVFTQNTGTIGISIQMRGDSNLTADGCVFTNNEGFASGGIIQFGGALQLRRCEFSANVLTDSGGGLILAWGTTSVVDCVFKQNHTGFIGGGFTASHEVPIVNCLFSRNIAFRGGGIYCAWPMPVSNCTFSGNHPQGLTLDAVGAPVVTNCILWGNTTAQIDHDPAFGWTPPPVFFSDVQGGWSGPGSNNLDADPLFVQAGTDDARLGFGSPCIDHGDTASLPADALDLDGDGDTGEPLPLDLADTARVQGAAVDMGAYEGAFEVQPPAVASSGVDQGEFVVLFPGGAPSDAPVSAGMIFTNVSGPDAATVTVTQHTDNLHPQAGGYSELGDILAAQTTLADGQFMAIVFIPFTTATLGGIEPTAVNLTWYDAPAGNWALAAAGNTVNSLGFTGPIGNRTVMVNGGNWVTSPQVGDYGVYWNPSTQQGFAWATVDHFSDFAIGAALCPADCVQTPDGVVGVVDMLAVLNAWGSTNGFGPCDVNLDGVVNAADLGGVLSAWGNCPLPSPASAPGASPVLARAADISGDSIVDHGDAAALRAAWGPCAGCAADLNGDGRVGVADHVLLLANWGPASAGAPSRAAAGP